MTWEEQLVAVARIALAAVLGGAIGVDREVKDRPAGLRTHMLVAASSALIATLGQTVIDGLHVSEGQGEIRADPIRLIEAIFVAVGFLGAGTIMQKGPGGRVEGLTTAASVMMAAAIGIAVAFQQYVLAVALTLLVTLVLVALRPLSKRLGHDHHEG